MISRSTVSNAPYINMTLECAFFTYVPPVWNSVKVFSRHIQRSTHLGALLSHKRYVYTVGFQSVTTYIALTKHFAMKSVCLQF